MKVFKNFQFNIDRFTNYEKFLFETICSKKSIFIDNKENIITIEKI